MGDVSLGTKCCASSLLNYSKLDAAQNCKKCTELEFQLQIVRDELSSAQLIIQMINKEQVQNDTSTTQTHHVEVEQIGRESWNMIKNKGTKRRSECNVNLKIVSYKILRKQYSPQTVSPH